MITINPSSPRSPSLTDLGATPKATTSANADPAGFASLLRQSQMKAPAAPPPTPAPAPEPQAHAPSPSSAPAPTAAPAPAHAAAAKDAAPHQATRADERTPKATHAQASTSNASGHSPANANAKVKARDTKLADAGGDRGADEKTASAKATDDSTATPTEKPASTAADQGAAVMPWIGGLQPKPDAPAVKGASGGAVDADAAAQAATGDAHGPAGSHAKGLELKAQDAAQQKTQLGPQAAASPAAFSALLAQQRDTEKPAGPHGASIEGIKDTAAAGAAAAGSAFMPTPTVAAASPPTPVTVATPMNAPDFAKELSVHVSVLAKDGVQHAELHLNPADMGPVSVQIVMDGTQAHVAFGADMAATRQAIEAGMPQLAGALADAGFTLAGGGVSQHAGGRGGEGGGSNQSAGGGRGRAVSAEGVQRVSSAARRVVTKGGVDLFA